MLSVCICVCVCVCTATYSPKKLLESGFSIPYTLFCLI